MLRYVHLCKPLEAEDNFHECMLNHYNFAMHIMFIKIKIYSLWSMQQVVNNM